MRKPLTIMKIRRELPNHGFGMVRNGGSKPHQGWDLQARVGTEVFAIARGTVASLGTSSTYGNYVILEFAHGNTTLYAFYAHLSTVLVSQAAPVEEGDLIALTGKSGNASNMSKQDEHLHFEIRTQPSLGKGLAGRVDPGEVLGYEYYSCQV